MHSCNKDNQTASPCHLASTFALSSNLSHTPQQDNKQTKQQPVA